MQRKETDDIDVGERFKYLAKSVCCYLDGAEEIMRASFIVDLENRISSDMNKLGPTTIFNDDCDALTIDEVVENVANVFEGWFPSTPLFQLSTEETPEQHGIEESRAVNNETDAVM